MRFRFPSLSSSILSPIVDSSFNQKVLNCICSSSSMLPFREVPFMASELRKEFDSNKVLVEQRTLQFIFKSLLSSVQHKFNWSLTLDKSITVAVYEIWTTLYAQRDLPFECRAKAGLLCYLIWVFTITHKWTEEDTTIFITPPQIQQKAWI